MGRLRVGQVVTVVRISDGSITEDGERTYLHRTGTVTRLLVGGATGESVKDPLYLVRFPGVKSEAFWREERRARRTKSLTVSADRS